MAMRPCKHLDYDEAKYSGRCELVQIGGFDVPVRYWHRLVRCEGEPSKVQFCGKGRGRINGVFQCYNPGEMHCYEADEGSA